ncbi:MAG: SusC/RagA family TonB-linked outer membrane protein [Bacteroidetes bacterium]|nr:SusC/RagA family TonB-linked outer membrane protein [Bacteroidota bacterium]MBS1642469.1 SusC/RagA family TonB-linked outer membrane protein [Bacteroidota bacterium]
MRKLSSIMMGLFTALILCCVSVKAQSQTVSGKVTDADTKTPIEGVAIKVHGTNTVAQTNAQGTFTIKASSGQTLVFSFIGYESQRVTITGSSAVNISLKSQSVSLDSVVVTAMDIKKNNREVGFSAQNIKGSDLKETQRETFLGGMQGRIAGAQVTATSGVPGASQVIILRGYNSMSLSNQPLFVIDGVVMDNSSVDATANVPAAAGQNNTSNDFTNRIADINPNDIASITVLKGPEATVLYGSAASNGAIVITTKRAKVDANAKGFKINNVNYDNSFRFQKLQNFPSVYNGFQNGLNGVGSATFSAFGPPIVAGTKLYDNVGNFFNVAWGQTHNVSMDFGTAKSTFRFSGSYYDQTGVVPNTRLTKTNFRLSNNTQIGKKLDINPSITYTNSANNKAMKGAGGYLLNLYLWPSTDDAQSYLLPNGHKRFFFALNNTDPNAALAATSETDNPFFAVNRNVSKDKTDNILATLGVNYNPTTWLTISGRFGYNYYYTSGFQYRDPESASQSSYANKGSLDNYWQKFNGYNHTITATVKQKFGKFNTRLTVGTRWNQYRRDYYGISGTLDSTRSFDSSSTGINTRSRLSRAALYGASNWNYTEAYQIAGFAEATIGYQNVVFLTASVANESSSILAKANRNYTYPGGSLSIIMSDIFPQIKGSILNYWKLRTSLASTARLPDPYTMQSFFVPTVTGANTPATPILGNLLPIPLQYGFTGANANLKPETQSTYEIGTELRLFNDRVLLDVDYYNTLAQNQIAQNYRASYGAGFVLYTANNSSVRNQGVEISLTTKPVRTKDFQWDMQFNFNHMWNTVLAIPTSIDQGGLDYYDAATWLYNNARGGLQKGRSTGTITSFGYKRQDLSPTGANGVTANNGAILVNATTGLPVQDATWRVRADRTIWFTMGITNRFQYKNWNLSFLWDTRVGGDIFNGTNMYLTTLGKSAKTADRMTPRVVKAMVQNGFENTANPTINTIQVTPYYNYLYYGSAAMPEEDYMEHDIKFIRLRDISLSYTMPQRILKRDWPGFKTMSFFITANDLILWTNYSGADPSSNAGNASLRGVGAIGFDYGNIAAPLSFNAGFRVGF